MGYRELPSSLDEVLRAMESSELVAEALGQHVFDFFLRNKRAEWANYRRHVTPYELKTYLSITGLYNRSVAFFCAAHWRAQPSPRESALPSWA